MKKFALLAGLGLVLSAAAPMMAAHAADKPGGTAKGAAIGAVAGHEMGGHTKTGAAVGAVAGHHERAKAEQGSK